ncbi:MAG TPA: adenylyltransferase/cytidyltransferase family protein [Candidatus Paceibacterota bacterium]|nr:adenylyltransferase/cytidyltransferase family protein [Candidatus Paceibacterota bacterium]
MNRKGQPRLLNINNTYKPVVLNDNEVRVFNIVGTGICEKDRIINDRKHLKWVIGVFKREGLKIVYTSGVYDLLHEGHVVYLEKAKSFGDILVVGVDDDELTRLRKPDIKNRPIVKLPERLKMLAHVRSVNILTVRTPKEHEDQLIVDLTPDVVVFSRGTKDINEPAIRKKLKKYSQKVIFLDPQSENSTTNRIRMLAMDGAGDLGKEILTVVEKHLGEKGGKL